MTLLPPAAPPDSPTDSFPIAVATRVVAGWASRATGDQAVQRRRDRWFTAGVVVMAFAVYLRSLLPGIGYSGDVAKWQYMSVTGGIPHASGYPLWVALIQAWGDLVPVGTAAWKTSLLSATIGAAAVGVLFRLLRVLGVRRTVAAATALTFAVTPTFWSQAAVAEVYTLHILFVGSISLCLARWRLGASNRWLLAGMAIFALALGHHMMTVLALPGIAWLVWSDRERAITVRNGALVALFGAVGACQYLYLLYANDVGGFVEVPVHNLADIWDLIRGGEFKDEMWAFSVYEYLEERWPLLGEIVGTEYLLLQAPIAYGIWRGLRIPEPARDISIHLLMLGVLSTVFATNYDVFDVVVFFLPLLFVLAVFLGVGLEGAAAWAQWRYPGDRRLAWGVLAVLVALPVISGVTVYRRASQRGNREDADRIERAIEVAGEGALLVTDDYTDEQYFSYYLLAEDLQDANDLALAGRVSADDVEEYVQSGGGEVGDAADTVDGVGRAPVLTASSRQARRLERRGLQVTEVAESVWRVEPSRSHTGT